MSYIHTYKKQVGDYYFDSQKNCYMTYDGKVWIPMTTPGAVPSPYYTDSTSTVRLDAPTATNMFEVATPSGTIRANMATGEVFFPDGMHRSSALYEFWQGFSKTYMPSNTELSLAKQELALVRRQLKAAKEDTEDQTIKKIAEKLQKKYGNEKFIMTKPDDLIKFIKDKI